MSINLNSVKNLVKVGSALNNEHRIKILNYCREQRRTISEIRQKIDLTYANVHKHVKFLEEAGLIQTSAEKDKRGRIVLVKSLYQVTKEGILKKL